MKTYKFMLRMLVSAFRLAPGIIATALPSLLGTAPVHAATCERPARILYSMVPESDAKEAMSAFAPILNDLRDTLGIPVETIVPSSYAAVVEGLLAGTIHIARLGPASYISAQKADPSLTAFATFSTKAGAFGKEGAFYHSLLVVKASSKFTTLQSVQGARVALVDPDSTSGARLPRKLLPKSTDFPFDQYFGQVRYAGDHVKAAISVLRADMDAAFVSSLHLSSLVEQGKATPQDFRVLWRSPSIPMDPFVYRGKLCDDLKKKIRAVFYRRDGKVPDAGLQRMDATRILPINDEAYDILRSVL